MEETQTEYEGLTAVLSQIAPLMVVDMNGKVLYSNDTLVDYIGTTSTGGFDPENLISSVSFDSVRKITADSAKGSFVIRLNVNNATEEHNVDYGTLQVNSETHILLVFKGKATRSKFNFELLRSINNNLGVGLYRTSESGEIIFANLAMAQLFGFESAEEVMSQNASDLYLDADARRNLQRRIEKYSKVENEEILLKRKDGSIFWGLLITSSSRDEHNRLVYDGGLIDITAIKELESQLKVEKQRAEAASRAKEQFLSTMSHELRTPMNAVIGLSYLLLSEDPKPEQVQNLKTLRFSAENLLSIINDILDFSKIEAGKLELERAPYDLHRLLHNIHESFLVKAQSKDIALNLEVDNSIPQSFLGDAVRLSQILNNLVSNAIKFTYQGQVDISISLLERNSASSKIKFAVKDSGIGIPQNKLNAIFELFTQASSSITRKYGGTGLGLTITKRLIDLLGGELEVVSKPGFGSEFFFILRLPETDTVERHISDDRGFDGSLDGYHILIVEDNEVNQILLKRFLENWGATYQIAENGKAALEELQRQDFDLVLMDLQMPVMDGYTSTREIRARKETKYQDLPILAVTASVMMDVRQKVKDAGMTGYVIKPFSPEQLFNKMAAALGIDNADQTS